MKIGSLATGYGGLDQGVQRVLGGTVAWTSDIDPGASKIISHRYPGAPNLGDLTVIDWRGVEPVDIITAGYPCQPFSQAGQRKGTADERHIWPHIAAAVGVLRPRLVLLENVAGHLSLGFGDVLGDLAALGYDAQWVSLRAADVGACHGRRRVFIAANPSGNRLPRARRPRSRWDGPTDGDSGPIALLPTPTARDYKGHNQRRDATSLTGALLPTPSVADAHGGHERRGGARGDELLLKGIAKDAAEWGKYAATVARSEAIHGPAPAPTEPGRNGPRLSPRFVEWMMMLPAGWVTDIPGLTRVQQLHALGNGVVPPQAAAALRWLLDASVITA